MSKFIIWRRGKGKTTELIKEAEKDQLIIVCASRERCKFIEQMAKRLKRNIPTPLSIYSCVSRGIELGSSYRHKQGQVLIDDVEDVLQSIIGLPCKIITGTGKVEEKLTLWQRLKRKITFTDKNCEPTEAESEN